MQRIIHLLILSLLFMPHLKAAATPDLLTPIRKLRVAHDSATFFVSMQLEVPQGIVTSNQELRYTPILLGTETERELPAICIAGRNRYYRQLRKDKISQKLSLFRADKTDTIYYQATVSYESWMAKSTLVMKDHVCGCLEEILSEKQEWLSTIDFTPAVFHPQWVFRIPQMEEKRRAAKGSAYIDFPVNVSEIQEAYSNNEAELNKIWSTIDAVNNDADCEITAIQITGYASPEGNYANNERLARERTKALTAYVQQQYQFPVHLLHTAYEAEDWEGFRNLVMSTRLNHQSEILRLIDVTEEEIDRKEMLIQHRYPEDYQQIKEKIYPRLRHSDYVISYTVRAYTDVEEAKRVMKEEPGKLSPYEFYKVAETYVPGSDAYNEVFLTMAAVYPKNQLANLNAANVAMSRGELATARRLLDKTDHQADANYARGILEALCCNWEEALSWFKRAENRKEAKDAIEQVQKLMQHHNSIETE